MLGLFSTTILGWLGLPSLCGTHQNVVMKEAVILLVEDDISADVRAQVLRTGGYGTVVAVDGFDALLKVSDQKPDLVISDLQMPRMSGF